MKTSELILNTLLHDEDYMRKVLPFLKPEYFHDLTERLIFNEIVSFTEKYNKQPNATTLKLAISEKTNLTSKEVSDGYEYIDGVLQDKQEVTSTDWIADKTEAFCQEKAIYNAVLDSIGILDGKHKSLEKGAIPKILSDALAVSFNNSVGHDYFDDVDNRFEFYHRVEERIPFDLTYLNEITKGGLPSKTLNIVLAGTGVGKSLFMCHCAAANLCLGKNVLYITMEMAEERIAERIDANLLDVKVEDLMRLTKEQYAQKVSRVKSKTVGKLIVKEYPTASASTTHFRALLNELYLKRNFKPDVIYVDYLNICASSRIKPGSNINSYTYVKSIAEELRGLGVEFDVPVVSATQTTRSGYTSSDPGLEDTSESFGLPATADLMFALVTSEDLEEAGQLMVKQLKNRYNDPTRHKRFLIGVDRSKMKLYNIEDGGQTELVDTGMAMESNPKKKFEGFKV